MEDKLIDLEKRCGEFENVHQEKFEWNRKLGAGISAGIFVCSTVSICSALNPSNKSLGVFALLGNIACFTMAPCVYRMFEVNIFNDITIARKYNEIRSNARMLREIHSHDYSDEKMIEKYNEIVKEFEKLRA